MRDAGFDRRVVTLGDTDFDHTHGRRAIGLHDVHDRALGALLDRRGRHDGGPALDVEPEMRVDELTGEQAAIGVREDRLEPDGPRGRVEREDLIVTAADGGEQYAVRRADSQAVVIRR